MTGHARIRVNRIAEGLLLLLAVVPLLVFATLGIANAGEIPPQNQVSEYNAEVPKTILELQQYRHISSIRIQSKEGRQGNATLLDLNPAINAWYLLKVAWTGGSLEATYHLENPKPDIQKLLLDDSY